MRNLFFTDVATIGLTAVSTIAALWAGYFTYKTYKKSHKKPSANAVADGRNKR